MKASRPLLRKAPPRAPIDRVRLQPAKTGLLRTSASEEPSTEHMIGGAGQKRTIAGLLSGHVP